MESEKHEAPRALVSDLLERYGELMSGRPLRLALGFRSDRSFLRAALSGQLPVSTFRLPNRRGRYARTRDVSEWLRALADKSTES